MLLPLLLLLVLRFNNHLRKRSYPLIENPTTDFETGVRLMQVVNALYDVPIPKHNANPKLRAQKLDNVELAFKMVEQAKIKTNFLKHAHLVDKDSKMILGMMWVSQQPPYPHLYTPTPSYMHLPHPLRELKMRAPTIDTSHLLSTPPPHPRSSSPGSADIAASSRSVPPSPVPSSASSSHMAGTATPT